MEYRTVSFYDEFKCIGGICEDSCCENWEIDLDETSYRTYKKQKGAFGQRLRNHMRDKDRQFVLQGTRCPFLNADNLCDIYIEMGEACLCETCTNFPRHVEEFDNLKEVSLTMSCPEVSRIMLAKPDKITFVCRSGQDADYGLKQQDRPARRFFLRRAQKPNVLDRALFDALLPARQLIFDELQNRSVPVKQRAARVLLFAQDLQEAVDAGAYGRIRDAIALWSGEKQPFEGNRIAAYAGNAQARREWMGQVLNMYEGLERIREDWTERLQDALRMPAGAEYAAICERFETSHADRMYEDEHILVYYIFNYMLGAAYDHDVLTKVKLAVISAIVIRELDTAFWYARGERFTYEDQVLIAHAYSKEVEHSYNNYESLCLVLSAHPLLDVDHMLTGLLS